jgi:hypothetical protein
MVSDSSATVSNRSRSTTCHEFVVGSRSHPELLNAGKSLLCVTRRVPVRSVSQFRMHRIVRTLAHWNKIVWAIVVRDEVLVMDD